MTKNPKATRVWVAVVLSIIFLVAIVLTAIIVLAVELTKDDSQDVPDSKFVVARGSAGAVATDDQRCSQAGLDVLKNGGNAVDAAVASLLCLGVVNFHTSGIGGGLMMLVAKKNTNAPERYTVTVIDAREVAPSSARESDYLPVDKRGKNIHMDTGWTRA